MGTLCVEAVGLKTHNFQEQLAHGIGLLLDLQVGGRVGFQDRLYFGVQTQEFGSVDYRRNDERLRQRVVACL